MEYWAVKSLWASITFLGSKWLDNAWQLLVACHFGCACNSEQIRAWTRRTMTSPLVWRRNGENCLLSSLLTIVEALKHVLILYADSSATFSILFDWCAGRSLQNIDNDFDVDGFRESVERYVFRSGHRCLGTGNHWMKSGVFNSKFFGILRPAPLRETPLGLQKWSGSSNHDDCDWLWISFLILSACLRMFLWFAEMH